MLGCFKEAPFKYDHALLDNFRLPKKLERANTLWPNFKYYGSP